ncbi:DNA polymerase III subunit delta' [Roseospira marina]|uniref:DNA polymerase III subunit delta' n=1 Tax=Roseospira marina TaxID=140057 RepID=UPI0017B11EFE|nr:DNA polymerase III subunit delta' [Roseospira marina]MBB4312598.1 DNA polymerase-3 subunit delta' [Roseospira marina]MBB5085386.1 DNA polymerase-3 subunit delta' [Roseospira marina]
MARAASGGSRVRAAPDPGDAVPRPRGNPHLIGQEAAEAEILGAWRTGRMSHAWLLTGPEGIGKATLAYRIARFVLSQDAAESGAPGLFGAPVAEPVADSLSLPPEHPVFQRVHAGSHADLRVIEPGFSDAKQAAREIEAGRTPRRRAEIVVDDVRGLGQFLSLTPAEGGWRVVVIDSADIMNRNAANAVLKVVEEPPRRALLLLVSHNPARLPATIPSRCRRLPLRPLAPDAMDGLLERYRPDLEPEARATLTGLSRGSIGRALALARAGGLDLYRDLIDLLGQTPRMDVARCHALGDRAARDDEVWRFFRDMMPGLLARIARLGAIANGPADPAATDSAVLARLARSAPLDRWVAVWEKTSHLLGRTEAVHLDRKQAVLATLLLLERAAGRT